MKDNKRTAAWLRARAAELKNHPRVEELRPRIDELEWYADELDPRGPEIAPAEVQ